jgi:hypothetical protein
MDRRRYLNQLSPYWIVEFLLGSSYVSTFTIFLSAIPSATDRRIVIRPGLPGDLSVSLDQGANDLVHPDPQFQAEHLADFSVILRDHLIVRGALNERQIDAVVVHLYGLSRADFDHILGTFPLVFPDTDEGWRKREELLDTYDAWTGVVQQWSRG